MKKIYLILTMILSGASVAFAQQTTGQPAAATQTQVTQTTPSVTQETTTYMGEDYEDPLQVSVEGGGLWAQNNDRLHDGSEIIGRLTYDITPYVAIGGESGGLRFVDESDGTKYGRLYGVPAMADLVLKLPIPTGGGTKLVPYIYGGAGAMFWSYSKSGYSNDTGLDARSRTHFAANPGAGLEFYLTPHVALFIEGSYLYSEKFDLKNAAVTPPNGKLNVDSIFGGGGITIAF